MSDSISYHIPVLLKQSIDGLAIKPDGTYVDVTFGGGGHSREILNRLGENGRLYAFDQDADALNNTIDDPRFTLIHQNFKYLKQYLRFYGVSEVDGVLGDFGVSSHQFDVAERGFSTRFEGALDMRMNQQSELTAQQVVNEYDEAALTRIFSLYGELKNARAIARAIIAFRQHTPIRLGSTLQEAVRAFLPKFKENKILAQIYQSIRIEVNAEMEVLESFLLQLPAVVKVGGRISLISYHSLEDRMVKNMMKTGNIAGERQVDFYGHMKTPLRLVNNKVIVPDSDEQRENPRSRSAKLRIAEKI